MSRAFKSERAHALNVNYAPAPIKRSNPPSPRAWRLNDLTVALLLVGTIAAVIFGVI